MTKTVKFDGRPVWAEVSLGALTGKPARDRRHVIPRAGRAARRKILAVIKSNAYGTGSFRAPRAFHAPVRTGWRDCSTEGAELRESGIASRF